MNEPVIDLRALTKNYGEREAVRGVDLQVHRGEVFALLGPNGAGKTTCVEILEGYRRATSGAVSVLGEDPGSADDRWRSRIASEETGGSWQRPAVLVVLLAWTVVGFVLARLTFQWRERS
ncbi:MAG: ATP-binding cassette domain-containing protein [Acidimicrobiia bacterium]|nr:ATP-binding cassette domain-containing protein [Acidimicrobiia bacterium]